MSGHGEPKTQACAREGNLVPNFVDSVDEQIRVVVSIRYFQIYKILFSQNLGEFTFRYPDIAQDIRVSGSPIIGTAKARIPRDPILTAFDHLCQRFGSLGHPDTHTKTRQIRLPFS